MKNHHIKLDELKIKHQGITHKEVHKKTGNIFNAVRDNNGKGIKINELIDAL